MKGRGRFYLDSVRRERSVFGSGVEELFEILVEELEDEVEFLFVGIVNDVAETKGLEGGVFLVT